MPVVYMPPFRCVWSWPGSAWPWLFVFAAAVYGQIGYVFHIPRAAHIVVEYMAAAHSV